MPRKTLTQHDVIETAMSLADASGIEMLSMRKVAQVLKVTPMSLYNHVDNKEDLLDLMVDRVVEAFVRPDPDQGWQKGLRARAVSMRQEFLKHGWVLSLLTSRISLSEAVMRDMDATAGCLLNDGLNHQQADWAKNTVDSFVYGFVIQEINFPVDAADYQEAAKHFLPMINDAQFPYMYSGAQAVASGTYNGIIPFEFGLDLVIEGITTAFRQPVR